jgi:hypothetical protein
LQPGNAGTVISKIHVGFEELIEKRTFFVVGHYDGFGERWCGLCFYICMGEHRVYQHTPVFYRPCQPAESPLYRLLSDPFESFEHVRDDRIAREYGVYGPVISDVVRDCLKYRDLQ